MIIDKVSFEKKGIGKIVLFNILFLPFISLILILKDSLKKQSLEKTPYVCITNKFTLGNGFVWGLLFCFFSISILLAAMNDKESDAEGFAFVIIYLIIELLCGIFLMLRYTNYCKYKNLLNSLLNEIIINPTIERNNVIFKDIKKKEYRDEQVLPMLYDLQACRIIRIENINESIIDTTIIAPELQYISSAKKKNKIKKERNWICQNCGGQNSIINNYATLQCEYCNSSRVIVD